MHTQVSPKTDPALAPIASLLDALLRTIGVFISKAA